MGILAIMLLFGSGVALADNTTEHTPGDTAQTNSDQTTNVSNSSTSVTVVTNTTSSTSSQSVGGPTNPKSGSSVSDTPSPAESFTATISQPNIAIIQSVAVVPDTTKQVTQTNPVSTPGAGNVGSTLTQSNLGSISRAIAEATIEQDSQSAAVSIVASAVKFASPGAPPALPETPGGLLDELHHLLTGTVVPMFAFMIAVLATLSLPALSLTLLLALALIASIIPVNFYTARLSRAGFLGAARSDVAGQTSICHSTAMGFITAVVAT